MQENETKIVLLQEIASRMTQKVVVLVLKYLRAARILRENLIEKTQKHFELLACHRSLAALYQYKRVRDLSASHKYSPMKLLAPRRKEKSSGNCHRKGSRDKKEAHMEPLGEIYETL